MRPDKRKTFQQLVQFLDLSWREGCLISQQLVSKVLAVVLLGTQQRDIRDRLFLGFHGRLVRVIQVPKKSLSFA